MDTSVPPVDQHSSLCQIYTGLLDNFIAELNRRFGAIQSDIAAAVSAMHPASSTFMLKSALQQLAELANVTLNGTELELAGSTAIERMAMPPLIDRLSGLLTKN